MKTGAVSMGLTVLLSPLGGGVGAPAADEWVQVERPQPRSGEDERPGRARRRRHNGQAAGREGPCQRVIAGAGQVVVVRGSWVEEPRSSLYRRLKGSDQV